MPLYMDIHHKVEGLTADAVMHAHEADVETQAKYGVQYLKYWFQAVLFRGQLSIRRESEK